MKFFSGLQDLLGLYEPGSSTAGSSPASPIPPIMFPPQVAHTSANAVRKKTSTEANQNDDVNEKICQCSHDRTVRFPEDSQLIAGFHPAPMPRFYQEQEDSVNPAEILAAYEETAKKNQCIPFASVKRQINNFHRSAENRQEWLSLKGERVSHAQMESLEEIFKRVQFTSVDFEYTFLDDNSAVALGEMIEFYDLCVKLNLSFNNQINVRGWTSIFRAVKKSVSLTSLNLRYTDIAEKSIAPLCQVLRAVPTPVLTCLHLENTKMNSKNLHVLMCALKFNVGLKELYLGDNDMQDTDGTSIYQLIVSNTGIQLLDLRNNCLGDNGMSHICDALKNNETLIKSSLTALVLWNNQVTSASMTNLAEALKVNHKLETLNIGNNKLNMDGLVRLKPALVSNSHLHRLGLQSTGIDCEGAIVLAECLADNEAIVRVDIRDNPIALAGLLALHTALKMNRSITLLNIDASCTKVSSDKVRPYQDEFRRYFDEIQEYCERNKQDAMARIQVSLEAVQSKLEEEEETNMDDEGEVINEQEPEPLMVIELASPTEEKTVSETDAKVMKHHARFLRSSSLTCSETVTDIHDRLREMSGSTHSLDSSSNMDSTKTIKKAQLTSHPSLGEWGSLPSIPQAAEAVKPAPVRKTRRFSVSPSSSIIDVNTNLAIPFKPSFEKRLTEENPVRPSTLAIGIPHSSHVQSGPSSAPVTCVNPLMDLWSPQPVSKLKVTSSVRVKPTIVPLYAGGETEAEIKNVVACVVSDLVNYVVYEEVNEVERKKSLLLNTALMLPDLDKLKHVMQEKKAKQAVTTPLTPSTPSRMLEIAEELEEETDEQAVQSVVRRLVKDVLLMEKEQLRMNVERKRKQSSKASAPV